MYLIKIDEKLTLQRTFGIKLLLNDRNSATEYNKLSFYFQI